MALSKWFGRSSTEEGDKSAEAAVSPQDSSPLKPEPSSSPPGAVDLPSLFFQDAPIGIALVREDLSLVQTNAAFDALFGECVKLFEGVLPDDQDGLKAFIDELPAGDLERADDSDRSIEVRLLTQTKGLTENGPIPGLEHAAELLFGPETVLEGDKVRPVYLVDATKRRQLETQMIQSQKMQAVGQLAGGIAHDFNNLLTAMIGYCDLLLLRHRPGDQSFADVMQVKQNASRAANLVRQLLAFSRQQTLRLRVIDITDVLSELVYLLKRVLGEGVELNLDYGRDVGKVRCDQGQIEQVILNLAVNARDAMGAGGQLSIRTLDYIATSPRQFRERTMVPGRYVLIEVSDTGTGIPLELQDRIFEPFFTTKEVGSGTGLGLATVYGIVDQTGGFLELSSTVGEGTTFCIYIPVHQGEGEDQAAPALENGEHDLSGAETILLVEDEDPVRVFSARALRGKGYEVIEARTAEAALDIMQDEEISIDLLITDVVMPGMNGPTLIKEIRKSLPDLRVICMSGYSEEAVRDDIAADEDLRFLAKPFSLKQLANVVKDVLGEK